MIDHECPGRLWAIQDLRKERSQAENFYYPRKGSSVAVKVLRVTAPDTKCFDMSAIKGELVLRRWGSSTQKFCIINRVDNVN